jgi:WD40 repeat protein
MELVPGQTIRGYEIKDIIGEGGYGAVYRAYQPVVGRTVAIKVIWPTLASMPEFIRHFEAEAQLVAQLEHPQIVPLYDYWRDPSGAYLVMRYLRGGSLRGAIQAKEAKSWEFERVVGLLGQIAGALTLAHRYGVVHRDVKPENILLDEEGNAYLGDFGIALGFGSSRDEVWSTTGSPIYAAPEQLEGLVTSPQSDQYSLAVVLYEMLTGQSAFPEITELSFDDFVKERRQMSLPLLTSLRPDLPAALHQVLAKATAYEARERYIDMPSFAKAFRESFSFKVQQQAEAQLYQNETLIKTPGGTVRTRGGTAVADTMLAPLRALEVQPNPYKGLRAFRETDAESFFGREKLIAHLINRLAELNEYKRFLAVVGPSGSGKSSVVKAGLIPALRRGRLAGSDRWFIIEMTPSTHPLDELEVALLRIAAQPGLNLREQLARDANGLNRAVKLVLPDEHSELLLVIDQFEEIFTLADNEAEVGHLLASLHQAVIDPDSRLRLVITLRADFYDRPLLYPNFSQLMQERTEVVIPLTIEELEQSIVSPAKQSGVSFQPSLVTKIISDVSGQLGILPLLQYGLTELFEQRQDDLLTLESYQAIGGTLGALAKSAEELYEQLNAEQQAMARQVFLRLVSLGEGSEDTRRRAGLGELLSLGAEKKLVNEVIESFARARLLTFDRDPATRNPTLEVAHEAILREWARLRVWLDESREDLRLQRALSLLAHDWLKARKDKSYLLRGLRLAQFKEWSTKSKLILTKDEQEFLSASLRAHQAARNGLKALVAFFVLAGVGALILAAFAFDQRAKAERSSTEARSLALTANAQLALEDNQYDLALALALEANNMDNPLQEVQQTLLDIAFGPGHIPSMINLGSPVIALVVSPDGRYWLTGTGRIPFDAQPSEVNNLRLWDSQTGQEIRQFGSASTFADAVSGVDFSPDGTTIVSASLDGTLRLWDVETGQEIRLLVDNNTGFWDAEFSPDGTTILTGSIDHIARLWDVGTGELIHSFDAGNSGEASTDRWQLVAFSPDGQTAISSETNSQALTGSVHLWDVETGEEIREFTAYVHILSLAYSPNGRMIASGDAFGGIIVWDSETGEHLFETQKEGSITGLVFSADGTRIAASSTGRSVSIWDIATAQELHNFSGLSSASLTIAMITDDRELLVGSYDGLLQHWIIDPVGQIQAYSAGEISVGLLTADENTIVAGSPSGNIRIWGMDTGTILYQEGLNDVSLRGSAMSPDRRLFLLGGSNGWLSLWDFEKREFIRRFEGHQGLVWAMAFSPDGRFIVSGADDKTIRLWDAATGEELWQVEVPEAVQFSDAAFSIDGQTVFVCIEAGQVIALDVETGQEVHRYGNPEAIFVFLSLSPDGQKLLTSEADGGLVLWNIQTGEEILTLQGHRRVANSVFSADGRFVISGSQDRTLRIWDVTSGQELRSLEFRSEILGIDISPDEQTVLVSLLNGDIELWHMPPLGLEALIEWTYENHYVRALSCDERVQFRVEPYCEESGD